ncbi:arrestin domain-containing protein 3-like [Mercenaria mercenaria]|uniref:arrestin domain-containing protein 3-like n=1 Tax=Mercenaria mercenaria TaxID=6596 RepID=UPI00234F283A|nr:arrestin domain-containing protein 3-like [Mercenaria mercenaria]
MSLEVTHELRDDEEDIGDQSGNVRQLEIVLLNNHNNTYYPGQFVQGHVIVDVKRAFITRGILLQFCGRAGVYWTEKQRGAQDKCIGVMHYEAQEEYFNIRNFIFEPGLIPAEVHKFPFKFQLVPPLPDNYEDSLCQIEYFLEVRLKQDTNTNHDIQDRQDILIVDPIDLNQLILPDVTLPMHSQKTTSFCCWCCTSPPLVAFLRLPRSGYTPGETIHIQADIENCSNRTIQTVKFTLYQERGYRTQNKFHKHRDVLGQVVRGPVKPSSTTEWPDIPLKVPRQQIFNVTASKIFGIRYMLEMDIIPSGNSKPKLSVPLEVTLGSIPLTSVSLATPAHSRMQPNKRQQEDREKVKDLERKTKKGSTASVYGSQVVNNESRQRRKDRNRKIYPEDTIDTTEYDEKIHSRDY